MSINVIAERKRWIEKCRNPIGSGGHGWDEPELKVLKDRLDWIADEMEDTEPRKSVEAERAIWCAMCRDVSAFPNIDGPGVEMAIELLYEFASDMERE